MVLRLLSIFLTIVTLSWAAYAAQMSAFVFGVATKLPSSARLKSIEPGTPLSHRIDQSVLKILGTPTGHRFCGAIPEHRDLIYRVFFINQGYEAQAQSVCRGYFSLKFDMTLSYPKYYFLIENLETTINAWTTPRNETIIFSNEKDLTDDRLMLTLIHEMTMSFDQKGQLSFFADMSGVNENVFGLVYNKAHCQLNQIVKNTKLKHMMAAIRAFEMEKIIGRELKINLPKGFADWKGSTTCTGKIMFIWPYFREINLIFDYENLLDRVMPAPRCDGDEKYEDPASLGVLFAKLELLELTFTDGSRRRGCEYLSQPLPFKAGTSFNGGPGPRIGGDGW